jgi:amino acid adenylation domain-containing protein
MTGARELYECFRQGVERNPAGVALDFGARHVRYEQLAARVEELARLLSGLGTGHRVVALLAGRGSAAYEGYLAAAATGATVVPLDPGGPAARNRAALRTTGASVMLTDGAPAGIEHVDTRCAVVRREDDGTWAVAGEGSREPSPARRVDEDIAYVLFTSGSTGRPKAVPVSASSVRGYVERAVDRYAVGPDSRLSHNFALTFDLSVFDLFVSWAGGATLCVPDRREQVLVPGYVGGRRLTHWFSVPSAIDVARRMNLLAEDALPTLRFSLFCGEPLQYSQASAWRAAAPRSHLENLYGPTELTISCTAYRLPAAPADWPPTGNGTVPIGRPHDGLEWRLEPVDEAGAAAELCVRGWQRFPGYLEPVDNATAFLPAAAAGDRRVDAASWYRTGDVVSVAAAGLVHHGRIDHQVKILGHRVELGEIEAALRSHPGISAAAAVRWEATGDAEPVLAAFFCAAGDVDPSKVAATLRAHLPAYMVPRLIRQVATLPLNANGKLDRGLLREHHGEIVT